MRAAATLGLALVLCTAAGARPVALVLAADDAARKSLVPLLGILHEDGAIAADDILFPRDPGDILDHALPRITHDDTLTVIIAGRLGRDEALDPALLADGGAVPLPLLFARLAVVDAASCAVLVAPPFSPGPRLADLLDLWPRTRLPVAILESRHARFLAMLTLGLDTLRADTDADGLVSAAELEAFVQGRLGPDSAHISARPQDAGANIVAGLGGPDGTPPLLLVTIPRLRDDAPVMLEQAAALRVRGVVADDRKVIGVMVNSRPAALTPADDPALEDLGYPGRTHWFEAEVPLAQTGFTEVDLTATDAAGNRTLQAFMVLVAGPGEGVPPGEPAIGAPDSIDGITPLWSQTEDWRFGFRLVVAATVHGRRGHPCRAQVQFRFRGGAPLRDYNGEFTDGGGHAAARAEFTPLYEHSAVQDIRVFMPQRELHLTPGGTHHLEMLVSLVDTTSQPPEVLATAEPVAFDVTEPSAAATVYRFTVEHNVVRNLVRGIVLHTRFNVMGLKGGSCQLAVYFQRADGRPLVDRNGRYRAGDGSVAIFRDFSPQFPSADFQDVPLFMPYDELDLPDPGDYALRARAVIWDRTTRRAMDASPWAYFSVTRK